MFKEAVRCFWRQGALLQNRAFLAGSAEGKNHLNGNELLFSCLWLPWIPTPLLKRSAILCLCWNLDQNLWKIKCILPTWNSMFRFITLTEFWDTIKIGTDHFPYSRIMARVWLQFSPNTSSQWNCICISSNMDGTCFQSDQYFILNGLLASNCGI